MEKKNWRICRICLEDLQNLTSCKEITEIDVEDNVQIITKIKHCSQIELKNPYEKLPLRICIKCHENLKLSYKFCMVCQDSERKFKELEQLNDISKDCQNNSKDIITEIDFVDTNEILEIEHIKLEILPPKEEPLEFEEISDKESSNDFNNDTFDQNSNDDNANDDTKNFESRSNSPSESKTSIPVPERKKRKYIKKPKVLEYRCEVCKEPFNTRSQMTLHMKTSHTQAYKCKDCNKAFDSNIARNKHERRAHMDPAIRPHKCDFCVRTFYRLDLLKKHKRVHTGEKPFVCEKCGIAFKQIHHLKNHLKSMTPCVLKMSIKI